MKKLFSQLLKANTAKDVTDLLEVLIDEYDVKWTPVGDRRDNIATINIGTDPAAGLTERITNAIDAVLELEWHKNNKPTDILSPRTAAEKWFKIQEGRLRSIDNAHDKAIQELAKKIKITLKNSERENYPTVEIRDHGIGIPGDAFSKTILSLHGGNKIQKLFLMGAYGQGGSTALSYNNFTIIISKPYFREKKQKPLVSWTIVRINPGDINIDKHEWFEYCVNGSNGQPFTFEIDDDTFIHGTLVRHIGMDLAKYVSAMTQPTNSLWYLAHHYIFDPIIPFVISDERQTKTKKEKAENRSVFGNNRRLTHGGGDEKNLTQYKRDVTLTFRDGKVTVFYWVLTLEGEKPAERIKNYTQPRYPIIISFNGQKQGYLNNSIIKTELKLPFLDKYLVVQVECDLLDNESKRQLFSSTREATRETFIKKELEKLVIDTLKEDDELKRLDKERKDRYMKKDDNEAIDKLRKRLATRINNYLKTTGTGKGVKVTDETKDPAKTKKQPPIPFNDPPTFLEITTPAKKEVYIGKTFSIKFKTDAHPNLFINPDWFFAVIEPHSFGSYTGSARVIDGYGIAYFKVREEIDPKTKAKITLELRPPRQKTLSDTVQVIAQEFPEGSDSKKKGNTKAPNIVAIFVTENDGYYKENEWTPDTVAEVAENDEAVFIYINDSNRHIVKLVERAQQYSTQAVDSIKNRYHEHIGFCAFMIDRNKVEHRFSDNDDQPTADQINKIKNAALENACETVCGMIGDFFDYIRTTTESEED